MQNASPNAIPDLAHRRGLRGRAETLTTVGASKTTRIMTNLWTSKAGDKLKASALYITGAGWNLKVVRTTPTQLICKITSCFFPTHIKHGHKYRVGKDSRQYMSDCQKGREVRFWKNNGLEVANSQPHSIIFS